jgi:ribosome maturation factor RimP
VKDKNAFQALAASALASCGYRLLEFVVGSDRRVRLVIDAEPDVDLRDCVRAHKAVIDGLRTAGEDPEEFTIEVQSPGENRLIAGERDLERFRGEGVVVRLDDGVADRRTLYGILLGSEDGVLRLSERDSRSEMSFELVHVKEVRLHRK